jgi:DNA-binding LytR/AlgR family response regulator
MKAKDQLELKHHEKPSELPANEDYIFIKADNRLVKIFFKNILYAEALQNYVCIHTTDKKYITYLTLRSIEENLPHELFLKVHKSYIVQLAKVDAVDGNELQVGQFKIPISRNNKEEVMQKLLANKFLKR